MSGTSKPGLGHKVSALFSFISSDIALQEKSGNTPGSPRQSFTRTSATSLLNLTSASSGVSNHSLETTVYRTMALYRKREADERLAVASYVVQFLSLAFGRLRSSRLLEVNFETGMHMQSESAPSLHKTQ